MKKERKVWAITLIAFWALAPNQTMAQQDSLRSQQLSEVVVTATKFPKNQRETGKVLTVIDREQINQSAGKDLAQVLNDQVSLIVNGAYSNPGKDRAVYLRGASNAYTLILLDGIPLNDPSGINGGAYDLRLISLDQVERIEILKGSQSTLYGSDAIAGVINIITRAGGSKKIEGSATVGYGSYQTWRGNATLQGSLDKVDYQLSYSIFDTEGISEAKDEGGAGNFDKDGATQESFGAQFGFRPIKDLTIKPFVRVSQFEGQYDAGAATDDRNNQFVSELFSLGLSTEWNIGKGTVYGLFGNEKSERLYDGTYGIYPYEGIFRNGEVYWKYPLSKNTQVVAGVNVQGWKMKDSDAVKPNPEISIISPFASVIIAPLKNLTTEIGGRYNQHSDFGSNFTYSFNPSYTIEKNTKAFFNVSTGFKAPSLNQLYGQFGANEDLKPEKSFSLEGGLQWNTEDRKWNLRAVWFNRAVEDVIVYTGAFQYDNFDEQQDHGLELEADLRVSSTLRLQTHYSYVTGEVKTIRSGQEVEINNLLRRPKHSVGATAFMTISKNLTANITARSFGKRSDQYFDLNDFTTKSVELDRYILVNAYVAYQYQERLNFFLDVKNILDADYEEVYGYATLGINTFVGVQVKF